jgi:molybdenum cofactor synthesis domain-containing protein
MNIEMISTGDELITGFITDTNASFLSSELLNIGIQMTRRSTVSDNLNSLVDIFKERSMHADIIIVNGGLGPTTDDLTTEAAAIASGKPLVLYNEWYEHIHKWYLSRKREMPEGNIKQAMLPQSSHIVNNTIGTACGFSIKINNCVFYFTPGVPSEFKKMIKDEIIPLILKQYVLPQEHIAKVQRFFIFGISESAIGDILKKLCRPQNITIGYRVDSPYIELKLISNNANNADFINAEKLLKSKTKNFIVAENIFDFYDQIANKLNNINLNIIDNTGLDLNFSELLLKVNHYKYISTKGLLKNNSSIDEIKEKFSINNGILLVVDNVQDTESDAISIYLHDLSNNNKIIRNLEFCSKGNFRRLGIAFTSADILRRYLNNANPYTAYEYIKDIKI